MAPSQPAIHCHRWPQELSGLFHGVAAAAVLPAEEVVAVAPVVAGEPDDPDALELRHQFAPPLQAAGGSPPLGLGVITFGALLLGVVI